MTDAHTSFVEWSHPPAHSHLDHTVSPGACGWHHGWPQPPLCPAWNNQAQGTRQGPESSRQVPGHLLPLLPHEPSSLRLTPKKPGGLQPTPALRPLPGWHVGVRRAERERGAANPWARRVTAGHGVNSLLPRGLCLPMAVSSRKLSCASYGSPSLLPSEDLLSVTGQMARTCALREFR